MDLTDQLLSVRHWLYQLFQPSIVAITPPYQVRMTLETEGRRRNFTRPQWSIDRLNHRVFDYGAGGYRDDVLWQLTYYGISRADVDKVLSKLNNSLQNDPVHNIRFNRIPGYRFNWQYPQPDVQPKVDTTGPGLPAGPYNVRVSGLDLCGNESAASVPVVVNLAAPNNALRVRVLRAPALVPVFWAYNIYINGRKEVDQLVQPGLRSVRGGPPIVVGGSDTIYAIASLNSLLGTGALPKEPMNSNAVRWKWLRVNSYGDSVREDDEQDGVFNGMVTMETSVMQERDQVQPDVVRSIGFQTVVFPAVVILPDVIPPPPNILPTNKIIFTVNAG